MTFTKYLEAAASTGKISPLPRETRLLCRANSCVSEIKMSDINISFGPSMWGVLDEVEFSTGYVYLLVLTMTQSQFLSENASQTFSKELYFPPVCGTLVPWPGIQPIPPLGEVWSPDHCIAREVLDFSENLSKEKKSTQGGATCCSFTHTYATRRYTDTHS